MIPHGPWTLFSRARAEGGDAKEAESLPRKATRERPKSIRSPSRAALNAARREPKGTPKGR